MENETPKIQTQVVRQNQAAVDITYVESAESTGGTESMVDAAFDLLFDEVVRRGLSPAIHKAQ